MKKKLLLLVTLVIFVLLVPRLFVVSVAAWNYSRTTKTCLRPAYILSVKPFTVTTDLGKMYPGDEYELAGEGAWYGITTLIFVGKDGAIFYAQHVVDDPIKGQLRPGCRVYEPVDDY